MTTRRQLPIIGNGSDGADYAKFIDQLTRGVVKATALREQTVPLGTTTVTALSFAPSAAGNVVVGDAEFGTVRGRFITRRVAVPKLRVVGFEYDEP